VRQGRQEHQLQDNREEGFFGWLLHTLAEIILPEGLRSTLGIGGEKFDTGYQNTYAALKPLHSVDIHETFMAWGEISLAAPGASVDAAKKDIEKLFGDQISAAVRSGDPAAIAAVKVALGDGGGAIVDAVVNNPGDENAIKRLAAAASSRILVAANAPSTSTRADLGLEVAGIPEEFQKAMRDISVADPSVARTLLAADQFASKNNAVMEKTVEDLLKGGLNVDALKAIKQVAESALSAGIHGGETPASLPSSPQPTLVAQRNAGSDGISRG
jgi:hypothetical protein